MIEKIQKFSTGGTSRQRLRDEEAAYRAAYANAGEDARKEADALVQSMSNYTSANPMVGRRSRENQARIYQEATRILTGGERTAPSIASSGADYVINAFYNANKTNVPTTASQTPNKYTSYHNYNWANGLDVVGQDEDLNAKVARLATSLANNIGSAFGAWDEKKVVRGLDQNKRSELGVLQQRLQAIAAGVKNGTMDARAAQAEILENAQLLGIKDQNVWDSYFGETDDLGEAEKNRNKLVSEGYKFLTETGNKALDAFVKSNNYNLATDKNNNAYIFDKNWNLVTGKGAVNMDEDYTGDNTEGMGFVLGDDGRYYTGNLFDLDQNHADYNKVQEYITNRIAANKKLGASSTAKYNHYLDMSEHDLINTFGGDLHDKQIVDVSGYFNGVPVVVTANDNNIDAHRSRLGHVNLQDSALTFYAMTPNGPKRGTYAEIVEALGGNGKVNIKGDSNKVLGLNGWTSFEGNLDNVQQKTEHLFTRLDANTYTGWKNWWSRNDQSAVTANKWENGYVNFDPDQDVSKAGGELAKQLIYWAATNDNELSKEAREIKSRWWRNQPEDALVVIREALRSNPGLFDGPAKSQYLNALKQLLLKYKNYLKPASDPTEEINIQLEKEGGILKAQKGAIVDAFGNIISGEGADPQKSIANKMRQQASREAKEENALRERAKEYGRTAHQQSQAEGGWKPQDTLRATALATDVAGLIAAISGAATGGVGSIAAIGTGVASTVMDTIADFSDDSISKGQAWKNLGINVGLTAGAAFGAKAPKILKSAIKLVPRIMMAAGTAGIVFDPEVHNTVKRMTEGKSMNIQDWRNIMMVLRMSTGIATAGVSARGVKKAGQKYAADVDAELKSTVKSQLDPDSVYVKNNADPEHPFKIKKDVLNEVRQFLKDGKVDEAKKALTEKAGFSEESANNVINAKDKRGWKFWKENKQYEIIDGENPSLRALAQPEELAAAELKVLRRERNRYNKIRNKNWFTKTMAFWDRNSLTGKALGLDPNNSTMMTAALAANNMSNKKGNFQQLMSDKRAIVKAADAENKLVSAMLDGDASLIAAEQQSAANTMRGIQKGQRAVIGRNQQTVDNVTKLRDDAQTKLNTLEAEKAALESQLNDETGALGKKAIENKIAEIDALRQEWMDKKKALSGHQKTIDLWENTAKSDKKIADLLQARRDFIADQATLAKLAENPSYYDMITQDANGVYQITKTGDNAVLKGIKARMMGVKKSKTIPKTVKGYLQILEDARKGRFTEYEKALEGSATTRKELSDGWSNYTKLRAEANKMKSDAAAASSDLAAKTSDYNTQKAKTDKLVSATERANKRHQDSQSALTKMLNDERVKSFARTGHDVATTSSAVTITAKSGDVTIPKGTKVSSFRHIRDAKMAETVAKQNKPNAKVLKPEEISKLLPKKAAEQVRGALFDPTSGKITVWNQGGSIESKYQHLRK